MSQRSRHLAHLDRKALEAEIQSAFHGVVLGNGISLGQAQVIDRTGDGFSDEQLAVLIPDREVKDDWSQIPFEELDSDCISHLDAEGLRYYIPALMLSLLDRYDRGSMRVISTISALDPRDAYGGSRHTMFSEAQRRAIAHFLEALPNLLELWPEDAKVASRSLAAYWAKYLS